MKWEADPKYKGRLAASKKGEHHFFCEACDANCKGGKSEIDRHLQTAKHKKNASSVKSTRTLKSMSFVSGQTQLEKSAKEGEIG